MRSEIEKRHLSAFQIPVLSSVMFVHYLQVLGLPTDALHVENTP